MGQQILGSSHLLVQQVVLDCDPSLIGDSMSIHLAQQAGNAAGAPNPAIWTLDVWVQLAQGWSFAGRVITTSVAAGDNPSRIVATATIPGAIGWSVQASCPTDGEIADLVLQSSRCCAGPPGVRKLDTVGVSEDAWENNFSTALSSSFVVKASAGVLRSVTLQVAASLATGTYYIPIWNAASLPADTTVFTQANGIAASFTVAHVSGTLDTIRWDFDELGVEFNMGAVLNLSSTEFVQTLVATNALKVISAEYR